MMNTLWQFFWMNGYGAYIWSAYGTVMIFMLLQWFIPWRRWKKYFKQSSPLNE